MALLAETLVEEWLNRQGFFTIRGIKEGVGEIDLLAIRRSGDTTVDAWHVEVQVGFRPITYMSNLTPRLAKELNKAPGSAFKRDERMLQECVEGSVKKKFHHRFKAKRRESLWPGAAWRHILVHGVFKDSSELQLIGTLGVELLPIHRVIVELCGTKRGFTAAAGTDIADLIEYYTAQLEPDAVASRPGNGGHAV